MKLVKLIETLELLREEYEKLKLLIQDQVKDDQIEEAKLNFDKLLETKKAIEQMEDMDIQVDKG